MPEPAFLEERRKNALEAYEAEPVPTWRRSGFWTTSLRKLELDALETKRYDAVDELPAIVREHLGDEEHAGLIVQRGASVVFAHCDDPSVTVTSLEEAVEQTPELVEPWLGKRLPVDEGKFAAANAAFWTGGAFINVPKNTQLEKPIQVVYLIDEPGTAQYAHTLAVIGEHAECRIREYCLGADFEGQALHAGAFELYARPGAQVDLAHYQDWGRGQVHDVSTKRVEVARDARVKWVPVHLGGHLTKQTLDIITAEEGSDMRHSGLYFTERDEHLDLFTSDKHEAGHTTGDTVWKGALTGESRASYEGLIHIVPKAAETHTYLQTHSMLLSQKAKGDAIPSLIVEVDNVSASHGGTVGELDEDQIFYMETRGIRRAEAVRVLVEGYFEEVVTRLDDPGLEDLVRRRIAEKLANAEDQVREFIGERVTTATRALVDVRADFPILGREMDGKRLVYLDSAATSQKPAQVIEAIDSHYRHTNANIHRGVYKLAQEATDLFEGARERIARFVGDSYETTLFTKNATEAINLVAYSWGRADVGPGDEVLITQMEHHSNIVPWQLLCQQTGATLRYLSVSETGELSLDELDAVLGEGRVKLVGVAHVSNVLGTINPVAEIAARARAAGAVTLVDGSQAVPQMPVDLRELDVDFYAWTGHKALGPTGVGVLHGRRDLLEEMPPFLGGGDMIATVGFEGSTWNELPFKFEAGTSPVAEGIGLGVAIDYLAATGMERIREHEKDLTAYALERLAEVESLRVFGPMDPDRRGGVVSFAMDGIHPHDVAELCDREAVCIRAGHHCAQPLMRRMDVPATARASFHVYNAREDIDRLIDALRGAREVFAL